MAAPLDDILHFLAPLVEADTTNPPRAITPDGPLVAAVRDSLPGFSIDITDLGNGSLVIDARRGSPRAMFNVHLDTVPAASGWSVDPLRLTLGEDRVVGLGVCDTKGAAAVLFALAAHTDHAMRLVLTTDEEAGQSACVRSFLETEPEADLVVVAEPTGALARLGHRGLVSARAEFRGESAHSSEHGRQSAVHDAARFITATLEQPFAARHRLNFGRIEGGLKPNMVAAEATVLFGFRSPPGADHHELLATLRALAPAAGITERFVGPALPSAGAAGAAQEEARSIATALDLPVGEPVDFWTEASLFAERGLPALVLGAGSIAQAHNADEFVTFEQLTAVYGLYQRIIAHHG